MEGFIVHYIRDPRYMDDIGMHQLSERFAHGGTVFGAFPLWMLLENSFLFFGSCFKEYCPIYILSDGHTTEHAYARNSSHKLSKDCGSVWVSIKCSETRERSLCMKLA